jgi:hypothetical protein
MRRRRESKPDKARGLLELAREHEEALVAAGLPSETLQSLDSALRAMSPGGSLAGTPRVLMTEIAREVSEIQAAVRKEFPANETFQSAFKANEPVPGEPRQLLALARLVAREAPDYSANLIKYAINAATVKHLSYLCDQLEKELGGADPEAAVRAAEEQIRAAAARAFAGKPELNAFVRP